MKGIKSSHIIKCLSLAGIDAAAEELLALCKGGRIFAFYGEMGAGKTTFIQAICAKFGVRDNVTSPTFAIINEYNSNFGDPVYHFDFYRIKQISEAFDMGVEEYFSSGNYCFIEWPEKIQGLLPKETITIEIKTEGSERVIFVGLV